MALSIYCYVHLAAAIVHGVQQGVDAVVGYMAFRQAVHRHVARYAAHTPHILALQIAAVAPAVQYDADAVAALVQIAADLPFRRRLRVLAVACKLAVDIQFHSRRRRTDAEIYAATLPRLGHRDILGINACRIVCPWRVRRVARKLVLHIHVDRHTVALQLKVAWHHNAVPPPQVLHRVEVGHYVGPFFQPSVHILCPLVVEKRPHSVEVYHPLAVGRNDVAMWRHLADLVHLQVVPEVALGYGAARNQQKSNEQ